MSIVIVDTPAGPVEVPVLTPALRDALDRIARTKTCPTYLAEAWKEAQG